MSWLKGLTGKSAMIIANPLDRLKVATSGKPIRAGDYFGGAGNKVDKVFGGNLRNASLFHQAFNPDAPPGFKDGGGPGGPFDPRSTADFIQNDPAEQIGAGIPKRFETQRNQVNQQANAAIDKNSNALSRRFAAMGAVSSGAAIKADQQARDAGEIQRTNAIQNVNSAEEQALEARDTAQAEMNFKQKVFNFERGSKMHELDLAERQQFVDLQTTEFNRRLAEFQSAPKKQKFLGIF